MTKVHTIKTPTYFTEFKLLQRNLVYFERQHFYHPPQSETDVYGNYWMLASANIPPQSLCYVKDDSHPLSGPIGILIPPFSVVEWKIMGSELTWSAFVCKEFPLDLPLTTAIAFELNDYPIKSFESMLTALQTSPNILSIGKTVPSKDLAYRAKQRLDTELGEDVSVTALASELKVHPSELTRQFKKAFGLSPVVYRNKLRVYDSMFRLLISCQQNVSEIGFDVGFSDVSRFNKEFKKFTLTTPSRFQVR